METGHKFHTRAEILEWLAESFCTPNTYVHCTDCFKEFKTMEEVFIPEHLGGIYCEDCYKIERAEEISRLKQEIESLKSAPNFGQNCYLYVIYAGEGFHKIGVSHNPLARLNQLQTGNHRRLTLSMSVVFGTSEAAHEMERKLHKMLDDYRLNGEWFDISPQMLGAVIFECLEE